MILNPDENAIQAALAAFETQFEEGIPDLDDNAGEIADSFLDACGGDGQLAHVFLEHFFRQGYAPAKKKQPGV